ncbi:hypothetical protein GJAV_G00230860 [Gymnothorax javanicus]|nr:hypothetical protein GJAV_G00230860 [Gymnothorax javanicus]
MAVNSSPVRLCSPWGGGRRGSFLHPFFLLKHPARAEHASTPGAPPAIASPAITLTGYSGGN